MTLKPAPASPTARRTATATIGSLAVANAPIMRANARSPQDVQSAEPASRSKRGDQEGPNEGSCTIDAREYSGPVRLESQHAFTDHRDQADRRPAKTLNRMGRRRSPRNRSFRPISRQPLRSWVSTGVAGPSWCLLRGPQAESCGHSDRVEKRSQRKAPWMPRRQSRSPQATARGPGSRCCSRHPRPLRTRGARSRLPAHESTANGLSHAHAMPFTKLARPRCQFPDPEPSQCRELSEVAREAIRMARRARRRSTPSDQAPKKAPNRAIGSTRHIIISANREF
jgi:hypothetical protein